MLKHANNITIRESMQNDVCKIVAKLQEMKEKKEAQLNNIDRLASHPTPWSTPRPLPFQHSHSAHYTSVLCKHIFGGFFSI